MGDKLKLGIIGLGMRGSLILRDIILEMPNIDVCAVCDLYEDRLEKSAGLIQEKYG